MQTLFSPTSGARLALLLAAGLTLVTPALAQNAAFDVAATDAATSPLQQALSAEKTPLSLPASALDASWRRFKPNTALRDGSVASNNYSSDDDVAYSFVTRGETLAVGAETFLLAYRGQYDFDDMPDDQRASLELSAQEIETPDGYPRVFPSQNLKLCLLNARSLDDLADIRAFDAQTDLIKVVTRAEKERAREQKLAARAQLTGDAVNQRVDSDLKQIGLALSQYVQDYDEKLPPMRSSQSMADIKKYQDGDWDSPKLASAQQVLGPYIEATEFFAHPTTRQIYRPNLNVSGRSLAHLIPASRVVTFYEAAPAPDGTRAVLYLDGHVTRERETNWPAIRAASDAIAPPFKTGKRVVSGSPTNATVTLYDAAAMAYMLRRQRDDKGRPQKVYLSASTNRIYYRDAKTKQAIWLSSSEGTTAPGGITIPYEQAQEFREFQGYDGQPFGRTFGDNSGDAATFTPKIKTALGANSAMQGSVIDVDTLGESPTVALRGTVTSNAQKTLAEAIAKKNAPGYRILNQLVVK